MRLDIELKNYRCFPAENSARLSLGRSRIAVIGINNAGKSTLLRSFYELRNLYSYFSSANGNLINMLGGDGQGVSFPGVADEEEVFSNRNDRDIELRFTLDRGEEGAAAREEERVPVVKREGCRNSSPAS
jgi:predicted ATPase